MGSLALDATPSGIKNNPDLTYDFITWYYSEQGAMGILAKTYAIVPPVESLYESPTWRNLPDERRAAVTDADAALELMLEFPSVIKRPVLVGAGATSVGFSDAQYRQKFAL